MATTHSVRSHDGTAIAFERAGDGPPVILVDGAFGHREFGPNPALARLLATQFTVLTYDRRGRGASGDAPAYAIEREIEDLEALIEEAGGSVCLYGISSGGALALETAAASTGVSKLALFELPFVVDDTRKPVPADFVAHLTTLIADDRRSEAIKYFMTTGIALPAPLVALMRVMPAWRKLKAVAHTLPYDAALLRDRARGNPLMTTAWASVTAPTLVIAGGKSPAWMQHAMGSLAHALPNAQHRTLEGQTHLVKAPSLAPVLAEFFAHERGP